MHYIQREREREREREINNKGSCGGEIELYQCNSGCGLSGVWIHAHYKKKCLLQRKKLLQ